MLRYSLTVLLVLAVACADGTPPPADGRPMVVATLHPVASVVRAVGGPVVRVRTLLPPGAHPHSYEATPREAEVLSAADLVVRVGGAADDWVRQPAGMDAVVFTEGMELVEEAEHEHGHDHDHGTGNPHVWLDPILVRDVLLPRVTDALVRLVPDSAAGIRERGAAYADSLTSLDAEIRRQLADVPTRRFIAAHPAWPYFSERYSLEQVGVLHSSPGVELGSRGLARLVDRARAEGVRAVIAEPQLGRAGVDALADELGIRVEVADAIGGEEMEGRESYLSLMRFNARAFARAFGAGP
ncbi:MAG: metal ABC transporter substrate-binding protein [Gemmatimonadota bacterium]